MSDEPEEHELDAPHAPPRPHRDSFLYLCILVVAVAVVASVLFVVVRVVVRFL